MISERNATLIEARGIDLEIAQKYHVSDSSRVGFDIEFEYWSCGVLVNHKYRTLGEDKRFAQDTGAKKCFWNEDVITDQTLADLPLIVTEGEFDALAAIQAGFVRAVSVPDGAPALAQGEEDTGAKYSYLADAPAALRDVREIIICGDADGPGINLLTDLSLRLGRPRCKWVRYPKGCKDLNDALRLFGPRGVTETINRAAWLRVDGVYRMSELPPKPERKGYDIGMALLSKHYRMRLGDFCVVTGIPGMGKTAFVGEICGRMVENYEWTVAFASFEQEAQSDHRRNLRTFYNRKLVIDQSTREIKEADAWIDKYFSFIIPDEDDDVTLSWLIERAVTSILQHGAKIVVVDPYNEMDHVRPPDMSLTEYTGFAIKQFRKMARKYAVHVIVVAHPAKIRRDKDGKMPRVGLYDISDSAHWANKADVGIVVSRDDDGTAIIDIVKTKYHDQIGIPGELRGAFDIGTNRYTIIEPEVWKGAYQHE